MSSTAIRRIHADIRELRKENNPMISAAPLDDNIFEWHFTIHGAPKSDYEGGIYHGRLLLPAEWPMKPPKIIFTTISGRFEVNTPICLSFSSFHPEEWQPSWGIRTILEAIISFFPIESEGAVGSIICSSEMRKRFAKDSRNYCCPNCGPIVDLIAPLTEKEIETYYSSPVTPPIDSTVVDAVEEIVPESNQTEMDNDEDLDGIVSSVIYTPSEKTEVVEKIEMKEPVIENEVMSEFMNYSNDLKEIAADSAEANLQNPLPEFMRTFLLNQHIPTSLSPLNQDTKMDSKDSKQVVDAVAAMQIPAFIPIYVPVIIPIFTDGVKQGESKDKNDVDAKKLTWGKLMSALLTVFMLIVYIGFWAYEIIQYCYLLNMK